MDILCTFSRFRNEKIPLPPQIHDHLEFADEIKPDVAVEAYHAMMECTEQGSN